MMKKLFSMLARAFSAGGAAFAAGAPVGAAATSCWARQQPALVPVPRAQRPRVAPMTGPHALGI
ncbi:MAG: hypothetical protein EP329_07020 [Deltaproteobacteria bacterium]|nr:MAG: hypothetical protein EP329_07020 [Deltaproteobacteria bacterium]